MSSLMCGAVIPSRFGVIAPGSANQVAVYTGTSTIAGSSSFTATGGNVVASGSITASSGYIAGNSASTGTNYTSNTLTDNYYEEGTLVTTLSNMNASPPAITLKLVRRGAIITIQVTATSQVTKNSVNDPAIVDALPTSFRPTQTVVGSFYIQNNAIFSFGTISVSSAGVITWGLPNVSNGWTNGAQASVWIGTFTYTKN